MQCFIVMQGRTYIEEKESGILWSEQKDSIGNVHHFWERMKEVKPGDCIFHYVRGEIVAISVAATECRTANKPSSIPLRDAENKAGYLVKTDYCELDVPVIIRDHFDAIQPHLPVKYSPFQDNADGNQGYLYPCNENLTVQLVELISDANIYEIGDEQLEFAMNTIRRTEHDFLISILAETEAEAKNKVRIGRQRFRSALLPRWNRQCALCSIDLPELLQASYAKPWKDSTNSERIDPDNGILLCRNHDALYSQGIIAFDGQGKIHISSRIPEDNYETYGIHDKMKVNRTEANKPYLKWHKRHLFKG